MLSRVLSLFSAIRVAYALSPPLAAWWRDHEARARAQSRPCNDFPERAYRVWHM